MKNTEISVVLILQGSKQADCKGFSAFVTRAFNSLFFLKKGIMKMAIRISPV